MLGVGFFMLGWLLLGVEPGRPAVSVQRGKLTAGALGSID